MMSVNCSDNRGSDTVLETLVEYERIEDLPIFRAKIFRSMRNMAIILKILFHLFALSIEFPIYGLRRTIYVLFMYSRPRLLF